MVYTFKAFACCPRECKQHSRMRQSSAEQSPLSRSLPPVRPSGLPRSWLMTSLRLLVRLVVVRFHDQLAAGTVGGSGNLTRSRLALKKANDSFIRVIYIGDDHIFLVIQPVDNDEQFKFLSISRPLSDCFGRSEYGFEGEHPCAGDVTCPGCKLLPELEELLLHAEGGDDQVQLHQLSSFREDQKLGPIRTGSKRELVDREVWCFGWGWYEQEELRTSAKCFTQNTESLQTKSPLIVKKKLPYLGVFF